MIVLYSEYLPQIPCFSVLTLWHNTYVHSLTYLKMDIIVNMFFSYLVISWYDHNSQQVLTNDYYIQFKFFKRTVYSTSEVERILRAFSVYVPRCWRDIRHFQADIFIDRWPKQQSAVILYLFSLLFTWKEKFCTGRHYVSIKLNLIKIKLMSSRFIIAS